MTEQQQEKKERVILAGVCVNASDPLQDTNDQSLAELAELAETAGAEVMGTLLQNRGRIESGTYMGEGKLLELAELAQNMEADMVIFDDELSPMQIRNIEDAVGMPVIDRTALILDIFAQRAQSRAGKIQVELAQLSYRLPRLSGQGRSLSRLGGGIGTRGPGETKLETSRRHIHARMTHLREELKDVQRNNQLQRRRREKNSLPQVALCGYTNAGKSSLLNALTSAEVLAEDKLFATLDPTVRQLILPDKRVVLLSDTVGFINKLPHQLIEAFRSTLDEVTYADVIVQVIDASDPHYTDHITVVSQLLDSIGAVGKPTLCVLNKVDKVEDIALLPKEVPNMDKTVAISVKTGYHIDELIQAIEQMALGKKELVELLIPFSDGAVLNELHKNYTIEKQEYESAGVRVSVWLDEVAYRQMAEYAVRE